MREYVIHAKLKNNLILARIKQQGFANVANFCEAYSLSKTEVGNFINLKNNALCKDGKWRELAIKLANALNALPEELFTEEQQQRAIKNNEAIIELSRRQALQMVDPIIALENSEIVDKLLAYSGLNDREKKVIHLRYTDDLSLEDIGKKFDLSRERIAQIERKAFRKMRRYADEGLTLKSEEILE